MRERVLLIVDDNKASREILEEAIMEVYPELGMLKVASGEDCLAVLRHIGGWSDTAKPDLILLDLNMPGSDGRVALSKIKSDPNLSHIPVIILSTSDNNRDIVETHQLYANSYIVKPSGYEKLKNLMENVLHYWLQVAKIPAAG